MANSKYALQYDEDNLQNKNKQINTINEIAAKNKQTITETHNAELKETEKSYDDQHRINAVQKLINERQVAENMANLGLTDSGLNRTQQTAVQLSYANQNAKLNTQRQSAIDALNRQMAAYITDIETKQASDIADVENTYTQNRQSYVSAMEQADKEAAAAVEAARIKAEQEAENASIKAQQEAEAKLYNYAYDKKNNSGDTEYRVFHLDGKEVKVMDGYNPYNRENNKIKYAYEAENYGFFSNGYQPKGVKGHGAFTDAVGSDNLYGKEQSVWRAEDDTLWYWNGRTNEYELYDLNNDGKSNLVDLYLLNKNAQ